jgi:TPR repeat protein
VRLFRLLAVLTLCLTSLGQAWAQLTPAQQAAKERGLMLYNQHKAISATPFLRIAAEAGDREAQYFLAESLRFNNRYMTTEAHHWYEAAARQGDYYAMIRLGRSGNDLCTVMNNCPPGRKSPEEWLREAQKRAEPQAQQGDAEAMYILYHVTASRDWLEKPPMRAMPLPSIGWQFELAKARDSFSRRGSARKRWRNGSKLAQKAATHSP